MNLDILKSSIGCTKISASAINNMKERLPVTLASTAEVESLFEIDKIQYYYVNCNKWTATKKDLADFKIVPVVSREPGDEAKYGFLFVLSPEGWVGVAFGTQGYLRYRMANGNQASYCTSRFLWDLYNILLDKECWYKSSETNSSLAKLRSYLLQLSLLAKEKILANSESEDVLVNANGDYVITDTNLLDRYGNRILVMHQISRDVDEKEVFRLVNPMVVGSTAQAVQYGFDKDSVNSLQVFSVFKSTDDLVFRDDIDIESMCDLFHLKHIQVERAGRLPEDWDRLQPFEFASVIKASVEYAVRRSKVDYNYIKPTYSAMEGGLCFLVPVYKPMRTGEPDCVLLISKRSGTWIAYTVLTVEQAFIGARLIAPQTSWLSLR